MAAKNVRISADGTTFYTIPGSSADISVDKSLNDDSIFGTTFTSQQATLKSWTASTSAFINKGAAGYRATIKRAGTPTGFTEESTENVEGNVYEIEDRDKSIWEIGSVTVEADGSEVTSGITIDYLQGRVIFDSAPAEPVTVTGQYLPTERVCYANSLDLSQSLDAEDVVDFCEANDNSGWSVFAPQQQSVELSLSGFYNDSSTFGEDVEEDEVIIIEIDPAGDGKATARGYFQASSQSQSGDVGSTETEDVSYVLFVPEGVAKPFAWRFEEETNMPKAAQEIIKAWEGRYELDFEYTPQDSSVTRSGEVWISDCSLSSSVEGLAEMTISFQGTGVLERN